jgi:L-2-hydroxycarboxylate dehydrogenase (NAD+)
MNLQSAKAARIPTTAITGLIVDVLSKVGVPVDDASKIAALMLEADLVGADAHGVFRLPQYSQRLRLGSTNSRPKITVNRTAPATALVDGDNGMGHLVVARAAETAIELARECGVAWVGCRMSGHAGAAGVYAALPLKADMVGLYSAVANANHMPLAGGAEPVLGTNPLAIAIPAGKEPPVVLDIATSIVSYGTIKNHRLQNMPLQGDWMIDPKTGNAVTDPHKSAEALLLPMAGYKGAGLALTLGLLAGTLNGALFGRDCVDFNAEPDKVTNTGQFVVALDPGRFQPIDQFKAEVDRHIRELRSSKALPGQSVRLPGDHRAQRRADRQRNGIPLAPELLVQLDKLAADLSIKPLRERNQAAPLHHITAVLKWPEIAWNRVEPWLIVINLKR